VDVGFDRQMQGYPLKPLIGNRDGRASEKIHDSEFRAAWEEGQKLNRDEALALATKEE
jgi:hypothetical protein